eukprot:Clim_evm18s234 gene=Clim_evmTU18s234
MTLRTEAKMVKRTKAVAKAADPLVEELKTLAVSVISNIANANDLLKIYSLTEQAGQDAKLQGCITGLSMIQDVFHTLQQKGRFEFGKPAWSEHELDPARQIGVWLYDQYTEFCRLILRLLRKNPSSKIAKKAVDVLMSFICLESAHIRKKNGTQKLVFANNLHERLLLAMLSREKNFAKVCEHYIDGYLHAYDDVRYYTLRNVANLLEQNRSSPELGRLIRHTLVLVDDVNMATKEEELDGFIAGEADEDTGVEPLRNLNHHKKGFQDCWLTVLRMPLTRSQYKHILIGMEDNIIPYMSQPILLADFLTMSFQLGGITRLISLDDIFILIVKHGLEYPHFFDRVYEILDMDLLRVKYRDRVFYLLDVFFKSPLLSHSIVAAFVKRMTQLCLFAAVPVAKVLLALSYNLLRRFPTCKVLIDNPDAMDPVVDPFVMDEEKPGDAHALQSSLWEIKQLEAHFHTDIRHMASLFRKPLRAQDFDIQSLLPTNLLHLIEADEDKTIKASALEYRDFDFMEESEFSL